METEKGDKQIPSAGSMGLISRPHLPPGAWGRLAQSSSTSLKFTALPVPLPATLSRRRCEGYA